MKTIRQLMTALLLLISIEGFGQSAGPAQTICISNTVITAATGSGTWVPLSSNVHEVYFDNLNYSLAADTISGFSVAGRYGFLWNNDTLWVTVVNCDTAAGTQTICESNSDTVSMHATGTGTWSALPGNPNVWGAVVIQQPSIPTTTITGAWFAGSYGFVWNTGTAHDTFYVLVDSSIYLSSVQVNQGTVCQYGADTFSVDAYSNNTMNYQWYWDGQPRGTNSSKFIFNYLNPGDSVWVVASNTIGCVNGHLHADTIPASFTVSTNCGSAGPDQTICEYSIATMAATGTGRWSPLLNNPTPIGFNYNEFIPNNQVGPFNATGVYGFVWYLYPIGVSDTVYITVDTAPVPSGLLTAGTCVGSDTLILAGTAGADTIHWMLGGNIVHISAASDSVYIPTQPGLYTEYTSNNTGCSTQGSNTVPVSICNCNLHDSIGTSPALCSAIQYTAYLTGAVRPQYEWGGYTWYGGINVYGNPVEFYPVSWDQSYTVWVNVTDSATGCVLRTSIVMPAFFYDSVSYQNLGGNNYLLTGFPSSPSDSVEWTIDGQNYFRYGVDTLIVSVPVSGANIHFYDLNCGGGDSTISIPPIACSAGPDQTLCQFVDSVWMAATGTGTWTALSSNPQIVHITTPSSATTPISGSWSTGVYGFVWTSTCGNDTMTVTIDSSAGSFVTYASQPSVCVGHGDTFSVFIPILSDTIHWYNNGVAVGTNSPTYIVPSVTAGESIWAVITTPNGFCINGHVGSRDTIPVSFTVNNCGCNITDSISFSFNYNSAQETFTAHPTGTAHPGYSWSISPAIATLYSYGGNTAWFENYPGGRSYSIICYIQDSVTGCTSSDTFFMPCNAQTDSISYVNVGGDNYIFTAQTASASPTLVWNDILLSTPYQTSDTVTGRDTAWLTLPPGANSIAVYDQGCGIQDSIVVIAPQVCSAGPDQTLCQYSFGDTITMAATGTGTWTALSSNPQIVHITTPSSATTPISGSWSTGVYGFVWTSTCGNDTMTVTIDSSAGSFVTYASQPSVCVGHGDTFSVFIPILSDTIHWYNNGVAVGTNSPTYIVPSVTAGESIWAVITTPSGFCTNGHLGNRDTIQVSFTVTNCAPDTVWPGDADDNKLVDNRDLLTIGLGYDSIGPLRTVQGNVWQADLATDWAHDFTIYLPTVNYVHADCDGNGTINADDTAAIALNWGDTHAKTNDLPGPWRNGIPALSLSFSQDTVLNNDTLTVGIILGSNTVPVSNIYGLAFTFNYDPLVIDSNYSIFAFNSSWLGTASNSININRNSTSVGQVKAAITGIDHIARSGNGQIATFTAVITTGNINGKDWMYYHNLNYISDITAIDKYGDPVQLNAGIDSNYVGYFINGVQPLQGPSVVNVYPNPAATQVRVSADADITEIRIIDMIGEIIQTININGKKSATLGISQLAAGVYTVQVSAAGGSATAKLIVSR